jgi:hypothetical protein
MKYYKDYFEEKIQATYDSLVASNTIPANYTLNIVQEMSFGTEEEEKNVITIVIKFLTGNIFTNSTIYPIQFIILSEVNSAEIARTLMETFANTYNMSSFVSNFIYHKQMYSTPTIMSNFNRTADGLRSMLFMSGTLVVTQNVNDFTYALIVREDRNINVYGSITNFPATGVANDLYLAQDTGLVYKWSTVSVSYVISNQVIKFSSLAFTYATTPDSQRISGQEINKTFKKMSSQLISFITPNLFIDFLNDCYNISTGVLSGNQRFKIALFNQANQSFTTLNMVLLEYNLSLSPGELPSVNVRLSQ